MLYNPQSQAFIVSVYSQAPGQAPQWYLNHHHCHRRTTSYLSFWLKETSYYDDDHSGHGVLDFLSTPKNNHVHILTQENFTDKSIRLPQARWRWGTTYLQPAATPTYVPHFERECEQLKSVSVSLSCCFLCWLWWEIQKSAPHFSRMINFSFHQRGER